jgi:hypothetical protein
MFHVTYRFTKKFCPFYATAGEKGVDLYFSEYEAWGAALDLAEIGADVISIEPYFGE